MAGRRPPTSRSPGPVDLGAGPGSAHVGSAVSVSGTISSTTGVWTVNNDGSVTGGPALQFLLGGTINNAAGAIITATGFNSAIELGDYDYPYSGIGEGFVNNYGTITGGTFADGVALYGGGIVTNFLGGHITSASSQGAVSLSGGTSRSVVNSGEISNTGSSFATGVVIQGGAGSITNNASGTIYGAYNGIWTNGSTPLTLINDGSITSTRGAAVELDGGGSVTNTGTVSSPFDGLLITGAATVTNTGTVESTGSGKSVLFSGGDTHTLNLGTGSVLGGNVHGFAAADNLVLQGTGTELAAKFLSFETLDMQGTDWTLTGTGTFTTSGTVTSGRLAVNGDLTIDTGIGPLSILSGGILGGSGTINGTVTNFWHDRAGQFDRHAHRGERHLQPPFAVLGSDRPTGRDRAVTFRRACRRGHGDHRRLDRNGIGVCGARNLHRGHALPHPRRPHAQRRVWRGDGQFGVPRLHP